MYETIPAFRCSAIAIVVVSLVTGPSGEFRAIPSCEQDTEPAGRR